MTKTPPRYLISRLVASLLGSYAFTRGFVTLSVALLLAAGMPYDEAATLMYLLAFLVLLFLFCWSFVVSSLLRLWLVLGGGAAAMTAAAWLLSGAPH